MTLSSSIFVCSRHNGIVRMRPLRLSFPPERKASFFFRMGNITEASISLQETSSLLKTQKVQSQLQNNNHSMKYVFMMVYPRASENYQHFETELFFFVGAPEHCRSASSTPGLYPLNINSTAQL